MTATGNCDAGNRMDGKTAKSAMQLTKGVSPGFPVSCMGKTVTGNNMIHLDICSLWNFMNELSCIPISIVFKN